MPLTHSRFFTSRSHLQLPFLQKAEELATGFPALQVEAERLAATVSLGVHGRRKSGMGESFWQFRRYGAEDGANAVDWRQSGKSQHLYVREREWEAAQAVWFWPDASATMQFRSEEKLQTKAERARLLALALGALLTRGGERIGLAGSERSPSASRGALTRIAHELSEKNAIALPPERRLSPHSRFMWLSDFLSPPEKIAAVLRRYADGNIAGHLVHIIDPAEEDFPFQGRMRFEFLKDDGSEIFGRAETVRAAYRARFHAHANNLVSLARRFGWTVLAHRTDTDPAAALIALYTAIGGETARRIA